MAWMYHNYYHLPVSTYAQALLDLTMSQGTTVSIVHLGSSSGLS